MIIALALAMMGVVITFAYEYGIITNPLFFILGEAFSIVGFLVILILWDDIKERIKRLEKKEKNQDGD